MTTARRLRRTLIGGFALGLVLTLFVDIAVLAVPIYDMQLYDRVLMSRNMDTLTLLSVACLMGLLLYGILDFLRSACFAVLSRQLAQRLHGPALELSLRRSAAGDRRVGPQIVRDVAELQSFLSSGAIATPLDALCAPLFIVLLFVLHPAFGCLALVGISGLIFAGTATELLVQPVLSRAHEQRRGAAHNLSRSLAEIELTDGQGMLPAIVRRWRGRYARALADLSRAGIRAQLLANLARSFRLLLQAAVMALGAVLIIRGDTTPGSLMGANLLLNKCLGPFDHLVESCRSWLVAREAWRRVIDIVRLEPVTATQLPADEGSGLVVNDLHVTTADGVVLLTDVNLTLAPGTLALVAGPNGSGKTTLLRVLAGVVPPTGGCLSLDGAPVTESNALGYLPQSVALMDATIAENIGRLAPDLSRVLAVARQVGVHDRVGRLQRGYETPLVGDGAALSGGMRQRVGLARALYNAPRLIVLDEPDASLDAEGVDALIGALRSARAGGAIVLVSSHRPALRNAADRVIELRQGRVLSPSLDPRPALLPQLVTA